MGLVVRHRRGLRIERRLFWVMLGVVLLVGLAKLCQPLATSRRQQDELTKLRLERAALVQEQARLQIQKRELASDAGLEAAARRKGYLREGERQLVFTRESETKKPAPAPRANPPHGQRASPPSQKRPVR